MTSIRLLLVVVLAFAAASVRAQATPEEIAFWESVRNSNSALELQAYVDRYPNGAFVAIARSRLAALGATPAPARPAAAAPPAAPASAGPLQPGDSWTYRLSYPKRWGVAMPSPATRIYVVKIASVDESKIVDQLSVDGGTASDTTHTQGAFLLPQGMSIYSPYLEVLQGVVSGARLGSVKILDAPCNTAYSCEAKASVHGNEWIQVPAGAFLATKLVVSETWRPSSSRTFGGSGLGGRTLTVWYAPQAKRVVKYQSRKTVGDIPPVDTDFDLELISYQLK